MWILAAHYKENVLFLINQLFQFLPLFVSQSIICVVDIIAQPYYCLVGYRAQHKAACVKAVTTVFTSNKCTSISYMLVL